MLSKSTNGLNGQAYPAYTSSTPIGGLNIHTDGTIFATARTSTNISTAEPVVVGIDPITGSQKFNIPLSGVTTTGGSLWDSIIAGAVTGLWLPNYIGYYVGGRELMIGWKEYMSNLQSKITTAQQSLAGQGFGILNGLGNPLIQFRQNPTMDGRGTLVVIRVTAGGPEKHTLELERIPEGLLQTYDKVTPLEDHIYALGMIGSLGTPNSFAGLCHWESGHFVRASQEEKEKFHKSPESSLVTSDDFEDDGHGWSRTAIDAGWPLQRKLAPIVVWSFQSMAQGEIGLALSRSTCNAPVSQSKG